MDNKKEDSLKGKISSRDNYESKKVDVPKEADIKKLKTKLENFKKEVLKKYKFTIIWIF